MLLIPLLTGEAWGGIGAGIAALGGVIAAYFGLRGAKATATPTAQEVINTGFASLTASQVAELARLGTELKSVQTKVNKLDHKIEVFRDRETRYQRVLRKMIEHVHDLRAMIVDLKGIVPEDPFDTKELDELLRDTDEDYKEGV